MNRKIIVTFCSVVVLVALVSIWYRLKPEVEQISQEEIFGINTGVGQMLGEETAKVVPDHGRIIVVATLAQLKPQRNYLWTAFTNELQKHNISITTTEAVSSMWSDINNVSPPAERRAAFKALLEKYGSTGAFVFLVDLPEWFIVAEALHQYAGPKVIAMDNLRQRMKPRYSGYFASGILAALISAPSHPIPPSRPKTPREWFDTNYQVFTPQNYDTLPE